MKKFIIGGGIIIIIAAIVGALRYQGIIGSGDRQLRRLIGDNAELIDLFNKALAKERKIREHPDQAAAYIEAGLDWKSIAERIAPDRQRPFFERALAVYERGIDLFGQNNILFYLNAGSIADHLHDYRKAEQYFKKAIEISPADESGYISLAEIYEYRVKKSKAEILAMYQAGIDTMVSNIPLIQARGGYLRRLGDYAAALEDYKTLAQAYPNNPGFQQIIRELEAELKKQ